MEPRELKYLCKYFNNEEGVTLTERFARQFTMPTFKQKRFVPSEAFTFQQKKKHGEGWLRGAWEEVSLATQTNLFKYSWRHSEFEVMSHALVNYFRRGFDMQVSSRKTAKRFSRINSNEIFHLPRDVNRKKLHFAVQDTARALLSLKMNYDRHSLKPPWKR